MYICRLFHRDRPAEQIDARLIADGALTVGRDPTADWALDDPDGLLSRIHCTLKIEDDALLLIDNSTNGTFVDNGQRAPRGTPVPLRPRQTVRLGALTLHVDRPDNDPVGEGTTMLRLPSAVPAKDWDGPAAPARRHPDASLLEAFCEGAKLDASSFSDEDPVVLMRRLGAIYQQTVLGLAALTAQRTKMKQEHSLDRTVVGAIGNNPVKWTAPRRLAQDLLRTRDGGFLAGEEAVRASFLDIAQHLEAVAAGANASIAATLETLAPPAIAAAAAERGSLLRGRAPAQVEVHAERHAALAAGGATRAFRDAYLAATE